MAPAFRAFRGVAKSEATGAAGSEATFAGRPIVENNSALASFRLVRREVT